MKIIRHLSVTLAALALSSMASVASAALITFDFTGAGANASTINVDEAGLNLRVDGLVGESAQTISWTNLGLGVVGNGSNQLNAPASSFEALKFYLPNGATWVGATLINFGVNESVSYCASVPGTEACMNTTTSLFGNPDLDVVSLLGLGTASAFSFYSGSENTGNLRVSSITVDVAMVPASGSFALLGLGMLALGLNRRLSRS